MAKAIIHTLYLLSPAIFKSWFDAKKKTYQLAGLMLFAILFKERWINKLGVGRPERWLGEEHYRAGLGEWL
ncbi:hypothetical protein KKG41_01675 [Patescibacteria group bacterium]|nr:hypothetical protein [Patescibacteria group bacterium]